MRRSTVRFRQAAPRDQREALLERGLNVPESGGERVALDGSVRRLHARVRWNSPIFARTAPSIGARDG